MPFPKSITAPFNDVKSQVGDASPAVQPVASLPTRQTVAEPESPSSHALALQAISHSVLRQLLVVAVVGDREGEDRNDRGWSDRRCDEVATAIRALGESSPLSVMPGS